MSCSNLGVVVCTHVTDDGKPALYAARTPPMKDYPDSGWQVTCGKGTDDGVEHGIDQACVVCIDCLTQAVPSLAPLLDNPEAALGAYTRETEDGPWKHDPDVVDE